jgi:hypothetical protein
MAYSESKKTLDKIRPQLQKLEIGEECVWTGLKGIAGGSQRFAYKLREGLYIARQHPSDYPDLARAAENFRIERIDADKVQAVLAPKGTNETPVLSKAAKPAETVVNQGMAEAGKAPVNRVGPQTAASIIQAWHDVQPSNSPLTFPQAALGREEKVKLYQWAIQRHLLIFIADSRVTMQPFTSNLAGLNWTPEDEE